MPEQGVVLAQALIQGLVLKYRMCCKLPVSKFAGTEAGDAPLARHCYCIQTGQIIKGSWVVYEDILFD